jgi:hypothetical protein
LSSDLFYIYYYLYHDKETIPFKWFIIDIDEKKKNKYHLSKLLRDAFGRRKGQL